ncbi:MAG: hypothetical protein R2827_09415 [Bdellovibrionales bacterium]
MLGEARFGFFCSIRPIDRDLSDLIGTNYERAYNFSHTKLSADILGKVTTDEYFGMRFEDDKYIIHGYAFKAINRTSQKINHSELHYSDYLRLAVGGPGQSLRYEYSFEEDEHVSKILSNLKNGYVVVQANSNDEKSRFR